MTEKTTIKEIENRLRADRADLASTLADLTGRIAPDYLSDQVSQLLKEYARPAAKRAEEAVRANPVAFALAGAGLAWLVLGSRRSSEPEAQPEAGASDPLLMTEDAVSDEWIDEIDELRETATDELNRLEIDAAEQTDSSRDFVKERADVMSRFVSDMRTSLASGLGELNEEARERIVRAREAAYSARMRIQDQAAKASASGSQMIKDHPLIATALGIAIGAALVNALPKPELNRSRLGPRANRLLDEARSLYAEEKGRARKMAGEVSDEVKRTARSVAQTARDEARNTARDISDQAMSAGQDLAERLARQLADEANRALKDVGTRLRERDTPTKPQRDPNGAFPH
ncbi:hypothetical protein [Thioclava atlantica]|uniref:DUF3618 domain-containing protein n=1 Tax=Thioclava atlantica TaxID=1317124 RepID=A0A085TX05_9RHOB|nr:hypothetical protein [Thioclava atlantica]KFE35252.1 hypothetical protein DW2_09761 [Thioclava atlantica]